MHSVTEDNVILKQWMVDHKIWQRQLCEGLLVYLGAFGPVIPELVLSQTTEGMFDRIVRRVRVEGLSRLRKDRERMQLDKLLLRFERIWRKCRVTANSLESL